MVFEKHLRALLNCCGTKFVLLTKQSFTDSCGIFRWFNGLLLALFRYYENEQLLLRLCRRF